MMTGQVCIRCVMDESDADIVFDDGGVCNHCSEHEDRVAATPYARGNADAELANLIATIKKSARGPYDSIIGLSGGVDSSYLADQAVAMGLRPLAVHFDNGWNSELAVQNIQSIVQKLDLDLMTFVIDWPEFADIQRSYFKANVIDIEVVTDHAIFAALYKIARQHGIRYILSGRNAATEAIMPTSWVWQKFDLMNVKAIHKRFGRLPIRRFPTLTLWEMAFRQLTGQVRLANFLDYIPYGKNAAIKLLETKLGWRNYGGKHYESAFTKFYQAHILPVKFGVDKRKAHYSDLIMNGEVTREQALSILNEPLYDPIELERDREYVCKKLGFSDEEFEAYLRAAPVPHDAYPSNAAFGAHLLSMRRKAQRA